MKQPVTLGADGQDERLRKNKADLKSNTGLRNEYSLFLRMGKRTVSLQSWRLGALGNGEQMDGWENKSCFH